MIPAVGRSGIFLVCLSRAACDGGKGWSRLRSSGRRGVQEAES